MKRRINTFARHQAGSVAIMFGLALPVTVALIAAAVNFSSGNWQRAEVQTGLDSAALAAVMKFNDPAVTPAQIESFARSYMATRETSVADINSKSTVAVNAAARTVEINYDSVVSSPISFILWDGDVPVAAHTKAVMQPKRLPVCIMITSPNQNHTLLGQNNAKIDLENCLVQVDTQNWDAVEMRDASYMHTTDGEHCFYQDASVHYGDVQPAEATNCTYYADPFKTMTVPPTPACHSAQTSGTFTPNRTFCGGLTVTGNATFPPGKYWVLDGPFKVSGAANVTANGAVFFLMGNNAGLDFSGGGTLNFTAASTATAGDFSGFTFFLDPAALVSGKKGKSAVAPESKITTSKVNVNGFIYLAGQKLVLKSGAKLNVNPGGIIADYLLPDNSTVHVVGTVDSSTHAGQLGQKDSSTLATATLIK